MERNTNRITDADRARYKPAIRKAWHPNDMSALERLTRVGVHSLGCTMADLRDSEIDEIEGYAELIIRWWSD